MSNCQETPYLISEILSKFHTGSISEIWLSLKGAAKYSMKIDHDILRKQVIDECSFFSLISEDMTKCTLKDVNGWITVKKLELIKIYIKGD